jgi:hypothetical protein
MKSNHVLVHGAWHTGKELGAKTIEVRASHVSLISQPDIITNLILEAAGHA